MTQPHVILLDGPLAGQRIKAALKTGTYNHRETGTEYQLGFTIMFRHHLRVGWSTPGREPDALDCARWLTSEVVKQQLDDLWRGSGVGALTSDARVARAEYEANAAIPPLDQPVDHKSLAEAIRRAERFVQARRRARESSPGSYRNGKVAEVLVLDDGLEDGSGFTPLLEADLVGLIAAARLALGIEVVPALGPCSTCGTPYSECEISADDPDYTTDANGNHEGLCCEDCGHHAAEQTFLFGAAVEPHVVGDTDCDACWKPQRRCGRGGLEHSEFGAENSDGSYWLYSRCDRCDSQGRR